MYDTQSAYNPSLTPIVPQSKMAYQDSSPPRTCVMHWSHWLAGIHTGARHMGSQLLLTKLKNFLQVLFEAVFRASLV